MKTIRIQREAILVWFDDSKIFGEILMRNLDFEEICIIFKRMDKHLG